MTPLAPVIVQDRDGLLGVLEDPESLRRDPGARAQVRLATGGTILIPVELLIRQPDGSLRLDIAASELARPGATEAQAEVEAEEVVVPVVAESAEVGKRRVETGRVAIRKTVTSRDEVVAETLTREEVDVERVPINRMVDGPVAQRQEGETLVIPVLKEVAVVEKRLMLVEEIRITRRRVEQPFSQAVPLRTETVVVDRRAGDAAPPPGRGKGEGNRKHN